MNRETKMLITLILVSFTLISCSSKNGNSESDKINIIVSILPQKTFVKAIGGNYVEVNELIPPGGSPATYEPKPSDLIKVEKAEIYFKIGHIPFEKSHAQKLIGLNSRMKVVDTSENVELRYLEEDEENEVHDRHHHEAGIDPHIWLSPLKVKIQIENITEALINYNPAHKDYYQKNYEKYLQILIETDNELKKIFHTFNSKKLLVFHPSWGYFAEAYGLEQVAIEAGGKEPTAVQLQHFIELAKKEDIKVIFVQSQFNTKIAKSIADEIGAIIVPINPLAEDYILNLKKAAKTIAEYL